jgi:diguanylate cyclase (GGDEF)-like protein
VRAASALHEVVRDVDIVARFGGDEFGLIAVECDTAGAELLLRRLREALDERQVKASVGLAVREAASGLARAWEQADRLMYAQKRTQWPLNLTVQPAEHPAERFQAAAVGRGLDVGAARRPMRRR